MLELKFKNGLIPVATQDYETGEVLMIAFMNEDAFEMTRNNRLCPLLEPNKPACLEKGGNIGPRSTSEGDLS